MLVNTITSHLPNSSRLQSTDSHNPSFYPMLDASPPSLTPSFLPSQTSPTPTTNPSQRRPVPIPPVQPSWPRTSLPRSSLRSYTHSCEAPHDAHSLSTIMPMPMLLLLRRRSGGSTENGGGRRQHICVPLLLHVLKPTRPRPQCQRQLPFPSPLLPPSLASSSTTNWSASGNTGPSTWDTPDDEKHVRLSG
jgi:hypothetical protein